jgi:hypothetical protein
MFGMIENANIGVETYLTSVGGHEIRELELDWKTGLGQFDLDIIEIARRSLSAGSLKTEIYRRVCEVLMGVSPSDQERHLGFCLPSLDEVSKLACQIAPKLLSAVQAGEPAPEMAAVFGASLRIVICKRDGMPLAQRVQPLDCVLKDGVWQKALRAEQFVVRTDALLLPSISDADESLLRRCFSETDWRIEVNDNRSRAVVPLQASATVQIPDHAGLCVYVIRLFTPCFDNRPYRIEIQDDQGRLLTDPILVAQSEARIQKFLARDIRSFSLNVIDLDGRPLNRALRMPVCQRIGIDEIPQDHKVSQSNLREHLD